MNVFYLVLIGTASASLANFSNLSTDDHDTSAVTDVKPKQDFLAFLRAQEQSRLNNDGWLDETRRLLEERERDYLATYYMYCSSVVTLSLFIFGTLIYLILKEIHLL